MEAALDPLREVGNLHTWDLQALSISNSRPEFNSFCPETLARLPAQSSSLSRDEGDPALLLLCPLCALSCIYLERTES